MTFSNSRRCTQWVLFGILTMCLIRIPQSVWTLKKGKLEMLWRVRFFQPVSKVPVTRMHVVSVIPAFHETRIAAMDKWERLASPCSAGFSRSLTRLRLRRRAGMWWTLIKFSPSVQPNASWAGPRVEVINRCPSIASFACIASVPQVATRKSRDASLSR